MNRQPSISIIIPTCRRPHLLVRCVTALLPQISQRQDVNVLICDDGSDDETRSVLEREHPEVPWYRGPHNGIGANRNFGVTLTSADWLIFVDDDCVPRPGFFAAYENAIAERGDSLEVLLDGATFSVPAQHSLYWEAPHNTDGGDVLISCNFAIPRRLFLEAGGFDPRFRVSFEDTEFSARLRALGVGMMFVPGAAVDHPVRKTPGGAVRGRRWESRVISSYDFGARPWQILCRLPRHVALVILSRFRNEKLSLENAIAAGVFLHEFLYFLLHLPFWILKHRGSHSTFWTNPAGRKHFPPRFGL